jgi:hypothetical protein
MTMQKRTSSILKAIAIAASLLGAGAAGLYIKDRYFDRVDEKQVTITGLPCANTNLVTPIWVEGKVGDRTFGFSYTGGREPIQYLPSNEVHEVTIRVGTCRPNGTNWTCQKPEWLDSKQVVTVDTRNEAPVLALATPQLACT